MEETKKKIKVTIGGKLDKSNASVLSDNSLSESEIAEYREFHHRMLDKEMEDEDDEIEDYESLGFDSIDSYESFKKYQIKINSINSAKVLDFLDTFQSEKMTAYIPIEYQTIKRLSRINNDDIICEFENFLSENVFIDELNAINSTRITLKADNFVYIHLYGNKNIFKKKFNDSLRQRMKYIIEQINFLEQKTEFTTPDLNTHIHLFETDIDEKLFKCFIAFHISDENDKFINNVLNPVSNFCRVANKDKRINSCKIELLENEDDGLFGYEDEVMHTANFVISFVFDMNDIVKYSKNHTKLSDIIKSEVIIHKPDDNDNIMDRSLFLPAENRLIMSAAYHVANKITQPVHSSGNTVVDLVLPKKLNKDGSASIKVIYDNDDNTDIKLNVLGYSFTNVWVQLLLATEYKADNPDIYDKIGLWYTGGEEN